MVVQTALVAALGRWARVSPPAPFREGSEAGISADAALAGSAVEVVGWLGVWMALGIGVWFLACRRLGRSPEPAGEVRRLAPLGILLVAALLRLISLAGPPVLSDDIYRYVWDGRMVLAGVNPYLTSPDDPSLTAHRDELWQLTAHRQVPTVYPPAALGLFSIAALYPRPIVSLKALLVLADLGVCALLLGLAARLALPPGRVAWYAWNPLMALEVGAMGHLDSLAVAGAVAAVLAVVAARRRKKEEEEDVALPPSRARQGEAPKAWMGVRTEGPRGAPEPPWRWPALAGLAAAFGALAKLAPALALGMWARQSRRPRVLLGAAGLLLVLGGLPVLWSVGGVPPGLLTYGVSWEFNGPLYEPLWRGLDAAGADRGAKAVVDTLKGWTGHGELWNRHLWNRLYPRLYPQLMAKGLLALLLLLALIRSLGDRDPVAGPGRLFGVALLASATVYPWYLLWVLPWAALAEQRAWLLVVALAPLAYLPRLIGLELFPAVYLALWGPPAVLALAFPRWRHWEVTALPAGRAAEPAR